MKVFNGSNKNKKSWCLKLVEGSQDPVWGRPTAYLEAVDSTSGVIICGLVKFSSGGEVLICPNVYNTLNAVGYDPHEHGNGFTEEGRLVVTTGGPGR